MLHSAIISPDRLGSERLARALELSDSGFAVRHMMDASVSTGELLRILRSSSVEALFLSFEDSQRAHDITKGVGLELPEIQIIGVYKEVDSERLKEMMRLGIRDLLLEPFEHRAIVELLSHLEERLDECGRPANARRSQLLSFFPSKPGVGASTIALNTATSLATRSTSRVLLADFDLSAGMVRFLLRLESKSSVSDAIELGPELDDKLWSQLITRRKGLDVLHSGLVKPSHHVNPGRLEDLLSFLRRTYTFICADHSGNFERHSINLLQESKSIFLVCEPDISSLHLAKEKMGFLQQLDVDARVSVVLNRFQKKPIFNTEQVADFLGVPIAQVFRNDYESVQHAVMAGTVVKATSELGKQFTRFAEHLNNPGVSARQNNSVAGEAVRTSVSSWKALPWEFRSA